MEVDRDKISPMMKQYFSIKDKHPDHIIFFRLGDFYEMFFDDAVLVSKLLKLTLTGRDCGLSERAPMCGVPYHSSEVYIKKLVELGHTVAICEQLTDPKLSKDIVVRDVIRIVTPGTLIESSMLDESSNNYICAVLYEDGRCSLCFADVSTGEASLSVIDGKELQADTMNELYKYSPSELIYNDGLETLGNLMGFMKSKLNAPLIKRSDNYFSYEDKKDNLLLQFHAKSIEDMGLEPGSSESRCVCGLFAYITDVQRTVTGRFTSINIQNASKFMGLDLTARRNLEIAETLRNKEKKGSLLWVLDSTHTSMGRRMLRFCIEQPLLSPARIMERLDAVDILCKNSVTLADIGDILERVYDLERLMTKVIYKTANPRDLKSLSVTAMQLPELKNELSKLSSSKLIASLNEKISDLHEIAALVENAVMDEPPVSVKDGGVIKDGFNADLDNLRHTMNCGQEIIDNILESEKEKTGIKNLKVGYNRIFGYYIEVTRSYYEMIPENYIRKQTLANCERFITEELKHAENDILSAKDKALQLESDIFAEVREFIASKLEMVQETASSVSMVDVLCSFAHISLKNFYVKPEISADGVIDIKDGRHPVVELMLNDEVFVPNDTHIDTNSNRMMIITGPNMSGKSTYMRQVALITLMAHIGCFVPARYAKISITDKIFTRVGASDDLTSGQSTFMVEMSEVADILKHATKNSLVILDEVGRGTSTFDGISIAQSVAEHICNSKQLGCKTLFATHYHELISLEDENKGIKNFSIAVKKHGDTVRFLRKIVPGGVDDSYGIDVAKLAGLPPKVLKRAKEILSQMEIEKQQKKSSDEIKHEQISFSSMNKEQIVSKLQKTNVSELSDSECREFLEDLIKLL